MLEYNIKKKKSNYILIIYLVVVKQQSTRKFNKFRNIFSYFLFNK